MIRRTERTDDVGIRQRVGFYAAGEDFSVSRRLRRLCLLSAAVGDRFTNLLDPAMQLNADVETHSVRRALRMPLSADKIAMLRRIT
jgi:hypothetical protein